MTSLAAQLQRLSVPYTQSVWATDKRRASLLFDPKEAANLDRQAVYAIGISGLEELEGLDVEFSSYTSSLFNLSSQQWERTLHTSDVNQRLDETIDCFLIQLSPYFLLKCAHKALEWLIYRYHIHQMNTDAVLRCAFPYHETKIFVRLIQLLPTEKETHRWHWIHAAGKNGVPLTRSVLINHSLSDPSFLAFICDLVPTFIKVLGADSCKLRAVVGLWAGTVLGVTAERALVTETVMSTLVPAVVGGLRGRCVDRRAACYMVLAQLASHSTLQPQLVTSLIQVIAKHISPKLTREALMCLALLCKTQNVKELPKKSFKKLCRIPALVPLLAVLVATYDMADLLRCVLRRLLPAAVKMTSSTTLTSSSAASDDELGHGGAVQYDSLLASILSEVSMETNMATDVARQLMEELVLAQESGRPEEEWKAAARAYLSVLQSRYAVPVDLAVEALVGGPMKEVDPAALQAALQAAMGGAKGRLIDGSTSLLLAVNHAHGPTRALAVAHLAEVVRAECADAGPEVGEMLLQRLGDDEKTVVMAVLDIGELLPTVVSREMLSDRLLELLHRRHMHVTWSAVVQRAVGVLCSEGMTGVTQNLGLRLLPYLLVNQAGRAASLATPLAIMSSPVAATDDLLKSFSKKWVAKAEKKAAMTESGKLSTTLNHHLITGCAKAISTAMDSAQMVASLCERARSDRKLCLLMVCALSEALQLPATPEVVKLEMAASLLLVVEGEAGSLAKVGLFSAESDSMTSHLGHWVDALRKDDVTVPPEALWWALRALVAFIDEHKAGLPDATWWTMDSPLVAVVVRTLDVLVQISCHHDKNATNMAVLHDLVRSLTQETLDSLSLSRLAALLWGLHLGSSDCHSVSAALQVASTHLVARAWRGAEPGTLTRLFEGTESPVLAGLLVCLGSHQEALRVGAVLCVKAARKAANKDLGRCTKLFQKVFKQQEEVIADHTHLQNILSKVLKKDADLADLVCHWVTDSKTPPTIRERLLFHLQATPNVCVLDKLLCVGPELLAQCRHHADGLASVHMDMLSHLVAIIGIEDAPSLTSGSACLDFLLDGLRTMHGVRDCRQPPAIIMGQITRELFNALPSTKERAEVVSAVLDIGECSGDTDVANQAQRLLKQVRLEWDSIQHELVRAGATAAPATTVKGRRRSRSTTEGALSWQRVTFLLEALQQRKSMKDSEPCVAALFVLLTKLLKEEGEEAEYRQRLLLSLVKSLTDKWQHQQVIPKQESVHVEGLVQVVRNPRANMQTKQYALTVMANLAFYFPELLLHHVMSIFTFVGTGLLAADDEHSLGVVSHTITTIVPALLGARSNSTKQAHHLTNQIIQVFVDAQRAIPRHRSLAVFTTLVMTLGPETALWRVLTLLVTTASQHRDLAPPAPAPAAPADTPDPAVSGSLECDLEFGIHVCEQFEVSAVVGTATQLVLFLKWLAEQHNQGQARAGRSKKRVNASEAASSIVDVGTLTGHQLRLLQFHLTRLLTRLLSTEALVRQVAQGDSAHSATFHSFVKEAVLYLLAVAHTHNTLIASTHAKFWKAIMAKAYEVIDKVLYLLPTPVLLEVVTGLLDLDLHGVRRKALELLASKLQALLVAPPDESQCAPLLAVVDTLLALATSENEARDADVTATQQMALFNLKLLCKVLGERHQATFVNVLKTVMSRVGVTEQPAVVGSVLLVEAEVVSVVRAHAIPYLPKLIDPLLDLLADPDFVAAHELVLTCGLTALHRLVVTLPHFLSPYLQHILTVVCQLKALTQESDKRSQAALRLTAIKHQVATVIAPRVLVPALGDTFKEVLSAPTVSQMALTCVMAVVAEHVTSLAREDLVAQHTPLLDLFCSALDLRNANTQLNEAVVTAVEAAVIEAMLAMVVRLSEASFRPMFYKLYDWGCREDSPDTRLRKLSFFRLADSLAGKLRSLFNLFVGQTLQTACTLLTANNSLTGDVTYYGVSPEGAALSGQLVGHVLDCLSKCMMHDTEGIFTGDVFNMLLQPVIDQMENFVGGDSAYEARMTNHVVRCLSHFMVAAREDSHQKALNYQVLLKARHVSPKVRFTALRVISGVAVQMGDEYVVLLPETIPFLAELMEDECEDVERECQLVIAKLEEVLGESLQKYF